MTAWLAALNALLLFANLVFLVRPAGDLLVGLFSAFDRIPTSLATFVGALVGLFTVAYQTKRGFRNLIASQEHRAQIERDARNHQAELQESQKEQDAARDRRILAAGLLAELRALLTKIQNAIGMARINLVMQKQMSEVNKAHPSKLELTGFRAPIFDQSISKLGLLGAPIAGDVVSVYGSIPRDSVVLQSDIKMLSTNVDAVIQSYSEICAEISHVSERLASLAGEGQ